MIVITDEERKIIELFDTATEFKEWLETTLKDLRRELNTESNEEVIKDIDKLYLGDRIKLYEAIQSCHVEVI